MMVLLSYVNLYVGTILSILMIATISRISIKKEFGSNVYAILLLSNIIIISALTKRGFDLVIILPHLTAILILNFLFLVRLRFNIFPALDRVLLIAFIIDVLINLFTIIYHYDPFGRIVDIRSDGLVRSNGLLGSSFLSVALNSIGLILAYKIKSKKLVILALIGFLLNQSLRSMVTVALFFVFILVSRVAKNKSSNSLYLSAIIAGISILLATTLLDTTSNILRVLTWTEAIDLIAFNPIIGNSGFRPVEFAEVGITSSLLLDSGITENLYLDFALHFGLPSALLLLIFTSKFFLECARKYGNSSYLSLLAFLTLSNSIYGNLLTTTIFVFFLFFQFSERRLDRSHSIDF